jgi:hypothetical protein
MQYKLHFHFSFQFLRVQFKKICLGMHHVFMNHIYEGQKKSDLRIFWKQNNNYFAAILRQRLLS